MKRFLALTTLALTCSLGVTLSQVPAPAPITNARKQLEAVKEANVKLLEQQAKTLQLLDEMEKTSQTLKTLGKRA